MPSLITLRPADTWRWDLIPHAYDEASRTQVQAMPGLTWIRDPHAPNARGFYRGCAEAVAIVAETLEAAGIAKVQRPYDGRTYSVLAPVTGPPELRSYQRDGATWLRDTLQGSGAALLADEMGIGKSAQAIAALDARGTLTPLVVCPAIVVPHWAAQLTRWAETPGMWRVLSYEGFQRAARGGSKRLAPLGSHDAVILDECHYLSNGRAARSKAVAGWLARQASRPAVIGLSGTPMTARPRDLWHVCDVLWPGRFGGFWQFTKRYCGGRYEEIPNMDRAVWVSDGVSRAPELARRLRPCMLRRTKRDVALELPPRSRVILDVALPAAARRDLARAAAAIDWNGHARNGVASLLSNIEGYKQGAAEALAAGVLAGGGRCLLLTTRRATAAALGLALQAPVVDGDTPAAARRAIIADAPCACATIYSITTGIDLCGFDTVIMVGLDWIPSTLLQAEARVHRIGQDKPVTIYYLCGVGTLDEVVRERVISRLDVEAAVLGASSDGLAADLGGGGEDELLAAMVASVAGRRAA